MRKVFTKIDKLIILCKNVQKTTSIYSETLGLKVYIQSPSFVQLRDKNNFSIYLQQTKNPAHLSKGYSPILSFHVDNFDEVYDKLIRYQLMVDGEVIETKEGKMATFLGSQGQTICINNMESPQQWVANEQIKSVDDDQIKKLLQKIKL